LPDAARLDSSVSVFDLRQIAGCSLVGDADNTQTGTRPAAQEHVPESPSAFESDDSRHNTSGRVGFFLTCCGKMVSMDKPRHPQVIRTWKVERIRKPSPPKKALPVKPSKKSKP